MSSNYSMGKRAAWFFVGFFFVCLFLFLLCLGFFNVFYFSKMCPRAVCIMFYKENIMIRKSSPLNVLKVGGNGLLKRIGMLYFIEV